MMITLLTWKSLTAQPINGPSLDCPRSMGDSPLIRFDRESRRPHIDSHPECAFQSKVHERTARGGQREGNPLGKRPVAGAGTSRLSRVEPGWEIAHQRLSPELMVLSSGGAESCHRAHHTDSGHLPGRYHVDSSGGPSTTAISHTGGIAPHCPTARADWPGASCGVTAAIRAPNHPCRHAIRSPRRLGGKQEVRSSPGYAVG
jgi:hypothetical protein